MRQAFVHDRIFHIGGAEQVFFDLVKHYTSDSTRQAGADHESGAFNLESTKIFTLFSPHTYLTIGDKKIRVTVALPRFINNFFVYFSTHQVPLLSKLFDYRNLIVFFPFLCTLLKRKIQKHKPERIVISSFAAAKNVISPILENKTQQPSVINCPSILYLHSPMQYIRENYEEYCSKLAPWQLHIFKPLVQKLRTRDQQPRHYDQIICNSSYTKSCYQHYYLDQHQTPLHKTRCSAGSNDTSQENAQHISVQYPQLPQSFIDENPSYRPYNYYLYVGRLVKFVRETDRIIQLFNQLQIPLIIMGSGPDEQYLKSIAGNTITFIGNISDNNEKREIIKQAKGLINLAKESCGIATMEALCLGVPVMGYVAGATSEWINEDNGVLATQKDLPHLVATFHAFQEKYYDRRKIKHVFLQQTQTPNTKIIS